MFGKKKLTFNEEMEAGFLSMAQEGEQTTSVNIPVKSGGSTILIPYIKPITPSTVALDVLRTAEKNLIMEKLVERITEE